MGARTVAATTSPTRSRLAVFGRGTASRVGNAHRNTIARRSVVIGGWLVGAVLALIAVARVVAQDRSLVLIWLNAYTFWIYMPAYALVLAALWFRRWVLLVVAVAIVACHLTWVLPDYASAKAIPPAAWVAPRLRVFSTNVRWDNPDVDAIMAEAVAADPDVILVQEFTPQVKQAAENAGLAAKWPYFVGTANEGARGTAIYSRLPLLDAEVWDVAGIPMTRASVEVGGRRVRLYNVHPVSPTNGQGERLWNDELETLRDTLAGEHDNLVVSGDFNMTQHHRWYGEFEDIGLRDAHVERGRGNATTWPNGRRWLPPIRIDQVFLGGQTICLSIREGTGRGSDHRPMLFEVAVMG